MSEPVTSIERRSPDALDKIVGTGDTRAMLEQVERNVRDVIAVARDRGFVQRYGGSQHEFFGFPAWSLLALTYGLVPFVEWTRKVDDGWEARAVVRTRDGDVVAAAEAMCTRGERNRRQADDHTLRAMAQTRAMRNALRSCLGAALVLSGFDFADPEGPATKEQVGLLHQLVRELGMGEDEAHAMASVDSFKDLNREDASTLIDRWTAMRDEIQGGATMEPDRAASNPRPGQSERVRPHASASDRGDPGDGSVLGKDGDVPGASSPSGTSATRGPNRAPEGSQAQERVSEPASAIAWERATRAGVSAAKAKAIAKGLGYDVKSAADLTGEQLARVVARVKDSA